MAQYHHLFTLAFMLESSDPTGESFTSMDLRTAVLKRIDDLDRSGEWVEAVGPPDESSRIF